MSLAQFGFGIAVFAVPDYLTKLTRLFKNPVAILWIAFYVLFLFGGFGSEDSAYFLQEIRTKMPLWVLPAALALMPALSERKQALVWHFFILGCLVALAAGLFNLLTGQVVDRRDLSPLVSHIRLGVYILLSLFLLLHILRPSNRAWQLLPRWLYALVFIVLLFWLFYLKSFTAVILFLLLFPPVLMWFLLRKIKRSWRFVVYGLFVIGAFGSAAYVVYCVNDFYQVNEMAYEDLPTHTALGNPYKHDTSISATENGNYIWRYLQFEEMQASWEKRSVLPFDGKDKKGNRLRATLIRYLASKNLARDASGIQALSDEEITYIENGVPNYLYAKPFNIKGRIFETLWELEMYAGSGDPNGKSLSARFELWKAAAVAIGKSPISGYGTGDVRHALENALKSTDSKLIYYGQYGPHNEYLAIMLAIGIPGLLWMVLALLWPVFSRRYKPHFVFYVMLAILLFSALNEDIFETQASITFYAFAFHFLLIGSLREVVKNNPLHQH